MPSERIAVETRADFTPDPSTQIDGVTDALAPLLLRRTQLLLWLMFFIGVGFTAIELLLAPALGPHTMVKFCGLTSMALVLFALHRPWGERHVKGFSLAVVMAAYVATVLSAILSPSHEYATSATLFVAAALTTATLLPWGAWAQLASVVVGALSLGANILAADGSLRVADSDPGVAVLLAFAASVAIAREMQRSRAEAIRHYHFRRYAEREVRALNASLEARVEERTSELVEANERLAAEMALKEKMSTELVASQQRLVDVVDNSTAMISLKDTDGRYLLVNREFERIVGLDRQKVIGRSDAELFGERRAAAQAMRDRQVLEDDGPHSFDDEVALADGPRAYVTVGFPLHGPDEKPYGVGTISTDITRLRRAEEKARTHQEDLAHVQRLHLVNQMAAVLAHEIHQPLGAIANYAQGAVHRLRDRNVELAELLPVLEKIAAEALRAGGILRGVRRLVTRQTSPLEPVDVNATVADAIHMLEIPARRNQVRLELASTNDRPFIIADKTQVEQVLVNVLLNGIDAAATTRGSRQVHIDTQIEDGAVAITVSDSGPGVAPEAAAKLFTPFFTTKAHGLGMGLAISRSIVEAHGGALSHESNPTGGAAFRIAFPLAATHGGTTVAALPSGI